jgi:hypothetical protein
MPFDNQIKAVALLGATTPARDLGLLTLQRTNARYRYSADHRAGVLYTPNPKDKHMNEDAIVKAVISALEQTDVWHWAREQMAQEEAGDGLGGEDDSGSYRDEFGDEDYDGQAGDESEQFEEHWDDDGYEDSDMQPLDGHRHPRGPRDPSVDEDAAEFEDEEPLRLGARRYAREPHRPQMLSTLRRFPKLGRNPSASYFEGEGTSPEIDVRTLEPRWTRSSASPFENRRPDGSVPPVDAYCADEGQSAAVRRAAAEQERRHWQRKLEAIE